MAFSQNPKVQFTWIIYLFTRSPSCEIWQQHITSLGKFALRAGPLNTLLRSNAAHAKGVKWQGSMAYDLVVGKSNLVKDNPICLEQIEFDDFAQVYSLAKRKNIKLLTDLTPFEDRSFSLGELAGFLPELVALMTEELKDQERVMLYKIISVVCFAIDKQEALHGVAD